MTITETTETIETTEAAYPAAMPDLPPGWKWTTIGEICEVECGITFPASEKQGIWQEGLIACLRTTNVQRLVEWDDLRAVGVRGS